MPIILFQLIVPGVTLSLVVTALSPVEEESKHLKDPKPKLPRMEEKTVKDLWSKRKNAMKILAQVMDDFSFSIYPSAVLLPSRY